jgi:MoaA/NifB/PqqE/SkfB family radical SAM enzyme
MLKNINLLTTHRCDLHCEHCLQGFPKKQIDFPIDLLDKLFSEALSFGVQKVTLTGGEPHLHPNFSEIVEKIISYGFLWSFVSHGQRTEPYLSLIEKYREQFDYIKLSIDSFEPALHDEIRGKKGAFESVISSVKKYIQNDIPVWISTSLNQKNKGQIEEMIKLAEKLSAKGIIFAGTIPTKMNQHLWLNDQEASALYQEIKGKQKTAKIKIRNSSALYTQGGINFCPVLNLTTVSFNPQGEMIFCCDTYQENASIGSLREKTFTELLQDWLLVSAQLQAKRAEFISKGKMIKGFDTCAFCADYFIIE